MYDRSAVQVAAPWGWRLVLDCTFMSPVAQRRPDAQLGVARLLVWSTLAVFAAISVRAMQPIVNHSYRVERFEATATTSRFLSVLGAPHPEFAIEQALRRFPADSHLLFVSPAKQAASTRIYYTIAYLAFPRPVSAVSCGDPGTPPVPVDRKPPDTGVAGVLFFEVTPPASLKGGIAVTPKLTIAPNEGAAQWHSYCP
jgi:hypothetical protein